MFLMKLKLEIMATEAARQTDVETTGTNQICSCTTATIMMLSSSESGLVHWANEIGLLDQ
jgi:hypothetical protein